MDFNTAKKWFQQDRIRELAKSSEGLKFLKLRSLSRREHLDHLFSTAAIDSVSSKVSELFREAFESDALDNPTIDSTIKAIYAVEREQRRNCEDELVNQLYRLEAFDWGGLHQNNLEKTNVAFDRRLPDNRLLPDLWNKASDHPSAESLELLSELSDFRKQLINGAKSNPDTLIQWLYENQGVRRFDASNRLFLILVDCSNFFLSWKLKRAKPLLDSEISSYLDNVPPSPGRTLDFNWEGTSYTVVSDAIIITKP